MADFVESTDQGLRSQAQVVSNTIGASPTLYGQTAATMLAFDSLRGGFDTSLDNHVIAQQEAEAKTLAKDADRALLVAALREINAVAQAKPGLSDAELAAANLPVHDTQRTPGTAPTQRPELQVAVNGQEHRLTVINPDTLRAARPAEARLIELYRAVVPAGGPLPTSIDQMTLAGAFTASRVTLQYDGGEIGKTVAYIARYVGARQQFGPAGTLAAASVAA